MRALTIAITICLIGGVLVADTLYRGQPETQNLRKATEQIIPVPPLDLTYPLEPTPPFDLPVLASVENDSSDTQKVTVKGSTTIDRRAQACTTQCIFGYHHDSNCDCVPNIPEDGSRVLVCTSLCIKGYQHDPNCVCVPIGALSEPSIQPTSNPSFNSWKSASVA